MFSQKNEQKINPELMKFIQAPFERDDSYNDYKQVRLNHGLALTTHYNGIMSIPKTPYFHPYNPTGDNQFPMYPTSVITVKFPNSIGKYLYFPKEIIDLLTLELIEPNKVELFFVAQNMPWDNQALLLRPHHWLHDKNQNSNCKVGIYCPTNESIACSNVKNQLTIIPISSHPGMDSTGKVAMTVCSPDGVGVMQGIDAYRTDALFSVVITEDKRTSIVLHWLLNPQDQDLLATMSFHVKNFQDLIESLAYLKNTRLNIKNGPLEHLLMLLAPILCSSLKVQKRGTDQVSKLETTNNSNNVNKIDPPEILFSLLAQGDDKQALGLLKNMPNIDFAARHPGDEKTLLEYANTYKCLNAKLYILKSQLHEPTEEMFSTLARKQDSKAYQLISIDSAINPDAMHTGETRTLLDYAQTYGCAKTKTLLLQFKRNQEQGIFTEESPKSSGIWKNLVYII